MSKQTELFDAGPRLLNAQRRLLLAHKPLVGKLYKPSNGTEGDMFMERWCDNCLHFGTDEDVCKILSRSMVFRPADAEYPREWRIGADHQPECTAFRAVAEVPEVPHE